MKSIQKITSSILLLVLSAWGYLALKYVRNVPVFTLVTVPILAEHWTAWLRLRREEEGRTLRPLLDSTLVIGDPQVSPDGRWLAGTNSKTSLFASPNCCFTSSSALPKSV